MGRNPGLDVLLELHGQTFVEDHGYWYKIEAWRVPPSDAVPHGIRYNLTFHDRWNQRLFGFDNAHAVSGKKKAGSGGGVWCMTTGMSHQRTRARLTNFCQQHNCYRTSSMR